MLTASLRLTKPALSADREGKEGVRIRFVCQREVPPFLGEGQEASPEHGAAKEHAVGVLFFGDARIIRMAQLSEKVKGTAHIEFPLRPHIKQRQIHGAAAAVAGMPGDVAAWDQIAFFETGIEVRLHARVR